MSFTQGDDYHIEPDIGPLPSSFSQMSLSTPVRPELPVYTVQSLLKELESLDSDRKFDFLETAILADQLPAVSVDDLCLILHHFPMVERLRSLGMLRPLCPGSLSAASALHILQEFPLTSDRLAALRLIAPILSAGASAAVLQGAFSTYDEQGHAHQILLRANVTPVSVFMFRPEPPPPPPVPPIQPAQQADHFLFVPVEPSAPPLDASGELIAPHVHHLPSAPPASTVFVTHHQPIVPPSPIRSTHTTISVASRRFADEEGMEVTNLVDVDIFLSDDEVNVGEAESLRTSPLMTASEVGSDGTVEDNVRFLGAMLQDAPCDMCGYIHGPCPHHIEPCTCACTNPASSAEAAQRSRILLLDGRGLSCLLLPPLQGVIYRTHPLLLRYLRDRASVPASQAVVITTVAPLGVRDAAQMAASAVSTAFNSAIEHGASLTSAVRRWWHG
eukprot:TRINITY_DN10406_c0_g1_i1.p1 TRINITY_DN10406_c0_g1~~TRINITY_DN10406_c0_g1_i1.p1  ORF type:complete len:445 (+),score=79.68 TRINITY_DN10406_c0_g1_i1:98-1432(+)